MIREVTNEETPCLLHQIHMCNVNNLRNCVWIRLNQDWMVIFKSEKNHVNIMMLLFNYNINYSNNRSDTVQRVMEEDLYHTQLHHILFFTNTSCKCLNL